tara:strand:- start:1256 stop:2119 length:864 start_codon:yes stop_codon:yes gene_type:complete
MNIKHSKYKNTGILFELLVRRVTADTLNGDNSPALNLIQKYFVKSELGKEYKLYETLSKYTSLTEGKANVMIQTLLETSKKLNRSALRREKYNLINEIKNTYNLEDFFKTKLSHYKTFAAFYTLTEVQNTDALVNADIIINNKMTLLEHLSTSKITPEQVEADILREFQSYDKDTRMLTYRILMENFNGKYTNLYESQKEILRQYINSVDSTPILKEFYNTKVNEVKIALTKLNKEIANKAVQIKINEVTSLLNELDKTAKVSSVDIVNILQYFELYEELKTANGKT